MSEKPRASHCKEEVSQIEEEADHIEKVGELGHRKVGWPIRLKDWKKETRLGQASGKTRPCRQCNFRTGGLEGIPMKEHEALMGNYKRVLVA